ncbi:cysteine--tRNA ligase [Candidatus Liberibacter africanus]|uniref:Cysteine--tRNA ligase n=1 Tax=Candidatus Liberibacter africanus PTSAPSY TaxID=1277257 RepID=A0A0G3I977_LIBAF|nr:cysteine--tRNA ligase [Candidatus Liberibacter africanus]AKK20332.1 cysteinyl-tRNA synthetase [Candidatus Liberibacter africanus PTSAPSY]
MHQRIMIYNTLERKIMQFQAINPSNIRMYVCGPTVYDFAHIGNARPTIVFDVLYRLLRHCYGEKNITYVRNITDIDDKIIERARQEYPSISIDDAIHIITEKNTKQFIKDTTRLACLPPTHQPRATDHIPQMICLIQEIISHGHAYQANNEILFDTNSIPDYGSFSRRIIDDQKIGTRVPKKSHKKHPSDFVLWKKSTPSEPGWESPWNRGRPGWHIECSAMSSHYLGKVFDIHGGGLDLIFPHHENEIAQSCCAYRIEKTSNFWIHNGFLNLEGHKMSKSNGNFITINELLETKKFGGRTWPSSVIRLAMLMTHYREPIDFTVQRLIEAETLLSKWPKTTTPKGTVDPDVISALCNDLNTVSAIQALHKLARKSTKNPHLLPVFNASAHILGIEVFEEPLNKNVSTAIEKLVEERLTLLKLKNFSSADHIREQLENKGFILEDYKDPKTGKRMTRWKQKY